MTITPTTVSLHAGITQQFTATATDENGNTAPVEWAASESIGNISPSGLFTAGDTAGNGTVTASAVGLTRTANITVTVDPILTLTPTTVSLHSGAAQQFVATAFDENSDPAAVTWATSGDIGTVDANGLFTAGETAGTGTVTASAVGLTETANITVTVDPVLTLTPTTVSLQAGLTQQFTATAFDENGEPVTVDWTTADNIGTVNSSGLFTAGSSAGTGTVTASAVGLERIADITVTVDPVLNLTPETVSLHAGLTQQFTAAAFDENGDPATVTWTTSGNIGTVNSSGYFTAGSSAGTGTVTASAVGLTKTANITVTVDPVLTLTPTTVSIHADDTRQFTAIATDENGNPATVEWAASGSIGNISTDGLFTAGSSAGTGTVTASAVGLTETANVTVTVDPVLALSPETVSLHAGLTQQFTATAFDENNDSAEISWTVSGNIGTVDENGLFTAGDNAGTGTVTASAVGLTEAADVTVTVDPVLTLTPTSVNIMISTTQQFIATAFDENNDPAELTWAVSGEIGTVDADGLFTAGDAPGTGTVTASAAGLTITANVTVTVEPVFNLTPMEANVPLDGTIQFTANAFDENGESLAVTWAAAENIGTIDDNGLFTATASGTGAVTATAGELSLEAQVTVTIEPVIVISPDTTEVMLNETIQFTAVYYDEFGVVVDEVIEWNTSGDIGGIDSDGLFTATATGEGTVTATFGEISAEAIVSVVIEPYIALTPEETSVGVQGTVQFTATVYDEFAAETDAEITWEISEAIGTIDENGLFTATAPGEGIVIATADTLTAEATVTVNVEPVLVLAPLNSRVVPGDSIQYEAIAFDELGDTLDYVIVWETTGNIGDIDQNGLFVATDFGEGTVTATADTLTAQAAVSVSLDPVIVITPEAETVVIGRKIHFKAELFDSTGTAVMDAEIVWSVEGEIGEIVDNLDKNSQFTATAVGTGFVVASSGGITAKAAVSVIPEPGIVVSPDSSTVALGGTVQFTANAIDDLGDTLAVDVVWAVTPEIGEISEDGLFTSTGVGEGIVTATAGADVGQATVKVSGAPHIVLSPQDATVTLRETRKYVAVVYDEFGNVLDVPVQWLTAGDVGTFDPTGRFTATKVGEGIVAAQYQSLLAQTSVTVEFESQIVIQSDTTSVKPDDTIQFTAITYDDIGYILDVDVEWSTTGDIGEIDEEGLFTAISAGIGFVVATYDTLTAEFEVTVNIDAYISILPDSMAVSLGDTIQYAAAAFDELGDTLDVVIEWSTTGDIGEIDEEGMFIAAGTGEGFVVASVDTTLSAESQVLVTIEPYLAITLESVAVYLEDIGEVGFENTTEVSPEDSTEVDLGDTTAVDLDDTPELSWGDTTAVGLGDTLSFSAVAYDAMGDTLEIVALMWDALGDVGEIEVDGMIIAETPGIGTITATGITADSDSLFAEYPIVVTIEPYIAISPDSIDVNLNSQIEFTATGFDALGDPIDVEVEWSTTGYIDEETGELVEIGEIDSEGIFTALTVGEGTVTATFGSVTVEAIVIVAEQNVYTFIPKDDDSLVLFGFTYPLDFMNGLRFNFVKGSIFDDIVVHLSLPAFATIDDELKQVLYFEDIISAVSFSVSVNGVLISPYTFGVPIEVSIPFDADKLAEIGLTPYDLTMMFVTSEGDFVSEGIEDVDVNMEMGVLTGKVAHFSDIAVLPQRIVSGVDEEDRPVGYALDQNYPNPFNPVTTISYALPVTSHVSITVYSILGQTVKTLVEEEKVPGYYNVIWDGRNENGGIVSSGLYIYQIQAGNFRQSKKLMFMK